MLPAGFRNPHWENCARGRGQKGTDPPSDGVIPGYLSSGKTRRARFILATSFNKQQLKFESNKREHFEFQSVVTYGVNFVPMTPNGPQIVPCTRGMNPGHPVLLRLGH